MIFQQHNQVFLEGFIMPEEVQPFCDALHAASTLPGSEHVDLFLHSDGGVVEAAHRMIDAIQLCPRPVHAHIVRRGIGSAATMLASYCTHRTMSPTALFVIHHGRDRQGRIMKNEDDILFWMQRTGMPYELIADLLASERHMTAEEALNLGFVNQIVPWAC